MTELSGLEHFLSPDPSDAGCEKTMRLMDVYVDLLLAGKRPQERFPDVAIHLRECSPCAEDLEGLLAAARGI